ncbi:response regulator [Spirosoma montaniterrae]|uniref:Two-component system response regulator n=1 Tax=Spirosoma montaniterrae TaxID=1178516 RepID=A0A1P9WT31_9BACT|nr:response regulator transcription factor [Spirosoma montaniterrae]AQG78529.1 two-component system response regulator [Spirosoma montaniterrae]
MKPVRLLLVDDHQLLLDSLQTLLASVPGVEVVGGLNDSRLVTAALAKTEADILVCDLHMPHLSGIDLTLRLRHSHPGLKVLLLTMTEDASTIREAVRAGVTAYVLKRAGRDELEKAITTIMCGQRYFSPEVFEQLVQIEQHESTDSGPLATLTEREVDVLRLIAEEHPTHQIAEKLFIGIPTVETHRRHLMQKLGVKSVVGMVKFAMKYGLVS